MTELSPVSFLVRLENLPRSGKRIVFDAGPAERTALASEHDLAEVGAFHVDVLVSPWKQDGFRLTGEIRAEVVQQCVVTLAPIPASLTIPVDTLLVPDDSVRHQPGEAEELVLVVESPDEPETYANQRFDIGAYAEELFALSLDPYPRLPDAELPELAPLREDEVDTPSPFARLKDLGGKH